MIGLSLKDFNDFVRIKIFEIAPDNEFSAMAI